MDAGADRRRPVHDLPRQPRRRRRAAVDPHRPRRLDRGARVDRQRLHPRLRRAPAHRLRARRPLRAQAHVPDRRRDLHRLERRRGARSLDRRPDRHPRAAGHRGRDRHPPHPDPGQRGLPARAAGSGARHLGRDQRPRRRPRPVRRRRDRRGHRVAVDLLAQRADRDRAHPARAEDAHRVPRARSRSRPRRPGACRRRPVRPHLRDHPRPGARLDQPDDPHRARPRAGDPRRSSSATRCARGPRCCRCACSARAASP